MRENHWKFAWVILTSKAGLEGNFNIGEILKRGLLKRVGTTVLEAARRIASAP